MEATIQIALNTSKWDVDVAAHADAVFVRLGPIALTFWPCDIEEALVFLSTQSAAWSTAMRLSLQRNEHAVEVSEAIEHLEKRYHDANIFELAAESMTAASETVEDPEWAIDLDHDDANSE